MGNVFSQSKDGAVNNFEKYLRSSSLINYKPFVDLNANVTNNEGSLLKKYKYVPVSAQIMREVGEILGNSEVQFTVKPPYLEYFLPDTNQSQLVRRIYFENRQERNIYLGNLLVATNLSGAQLYSELNEGVQDQLFYLELVRTAEGSQINRKMLDLTTKIALMAWICHLLTVVPNAYINPQAIILENSQFLLTSIEPLNKDMHRQLVIEHNFELIIVWLLKNGQPSFEQLSKMTED